MGGQLTAEALYPFGLQFANLCSEGQLLHQLEHILVLGAGHGGFWLMGKMVGLTVSWDRQPPGQGGGSTSTEQLLPTSPAVSSLPVPTTGSPGGRGATTDPGPGGRTPEV